MDRTSLSKQASLWVVVPIVLAVFVLGLLVYYRRWTGRATRASERVLLGIPMLIFLAAYVYLTLSSRPPEANARANFTPFWSYEQAFDGFRIRRLSVARQILLNILLYIPFGILMPLALRGSRRPCLHTMLAGLLLSLCTETLQYLTHRGLCETDDLLSNTLGTAIGICMLQLGVRCIHTWVRRPGATIRIK